MLFKMETIFEEKIKEGDLIIGIDCVNSSYNVEEMYHVTKILSSSYISGFESCIYLDTVETGYANKRWLDSSHIYLKYPDCVKFISEGQKEVCEELYEELLKVKGHKKFLRKLKFENIG